VSATPEPRQVYTVSRLNAEVRGVLEGFPAIWVEGEVSNLARPASGHLYLTLKDPGAQVRCAMWRPRAQRLGFAIADGMQLLCRARVGLYEPRGEFQLILEHAEPAGDGALRRRFEELKRKLAAEGLFDPARKRPLPGSIATVGVVTSASGAALHDVLTTLARRAPSLRVIVYPTAVQGAAAVGEIVAALRAAGARAECDVLLVVRGGGSLEDLWCFNDEAVARAIAASPIPTVSGIGHEVDTTIADFVADLRAPTPTAAAERVSPDADEQLRRLEALALRSRAGIGRELRRAAERARFLAHRLAQLDPRQRLAQRAQRLDELDGRLRRALALGLERQRGRAAAAAEALRRHAPAARLAALRGRTDLLHARLGHAVGTALGGRRERLARAAGSLEATSPLATLARGYAIVSGPDGRALRDARAVAVGAEVEARLARGRLAARVTRVIDPDAGDGDR
jgi:exodeoxyribonuclease VII large subunit